MKKIVMMVPCCLLNLLWAQPDNSQVLKQQLVGIDTVIHQVLRDWKVPGIALGVVYRDQLIFAKGFGYRGIEKQLPVTPQTVFPIASCTKAFTAMLVGIAEANKLLDINKPVHAYFRELEFYTPQLTAMVTPKDMMTHRTGLPRHDWMTNSRDPLPIDTIIHRIRYLEPSKGIREEVQYSNLMYVALGELVHKVTQKSWAQQIQEQIFDPLEMNESSTAYADLIKSAEFSQGYYLRNDTLAAGSPSSEGPNAGGSINSSVADMSHWLIAWIYGGKYKGRQVLPARFVIDAAIPQMSTPSRPNPALPAYPDAFFGDMGYGWIIDSYRGHFHVQHSGDLPLYSSNTAFFPTDSIGIVVFANKFDATVPEMVSSYVADRLLGLPYKNWNKLLLELHKKRSANDDSKRITPAEQPRAMAHPLAQYIGRYYNPGYGIIKISLSQGHLSATHNDQPFSFIPDGGDTFRANVPEGKLRFFADESGTIASVRGTFEAGISDIVFYKVGEF